MRQVLASLVTKTFWSLLIILLEVSELSLELQNNGTKCVCLGGGAEFEVPPTVLMKTRVSLNFALCRLVNV